MNRVLLSKNHDFTKIHTQFLLWFPSNQPKTKRNANGHLGKTVSPPFPHPFSSLQAICPEFCVLTDFRRGKQMGIRVLCTKTLLLYSKQINVFPNEEDLSFLYDR